MGVENERTDPARAAFGISKHDDRIGDAAIGNQVLDSAEHKMTAAGAIGRFHFQRIGACLGIGKYERHDLFTALLSRQITLLLILISEPRNWVLANGRVRREQSSQPAPLAANPAQRFGISRYVGAAAAILLLDRHSQQVVFF